MKKRTALSSPRKTGTTRRLRRWRSWHTAAPLSWWEWILRLTWPTCITARCFYWVCRLEAEPVPGLVEYVKYMLVERREIPKKPKEIEDLTEDARRQTIADLLQ
uniref:Uncharacterized protein n=1 Tax=Bionectria ochroleuca TaxID=29856 RepID=A0A8H7TTA8_BIOOC